MKAKHDEVVNHLTQGQEAGPQQESHEAPHFPKQAEDAESLLLFYGLITQLLVEDVHLKEIRPADSRNIID